MSIARRFRDLVVVESPLEGYADTDRYGDLDDSVDEAWAGVETRALVMHVGSTEDEVDRETVQRRFDVYLPPSVTITANSRVRITVEENVEVVARVLGEPTVYTTFSRGLSHKLARCEEVSG